MEAVLAVGYRVRSQRGNQFPPWAYSFFVPFADDAPATKAGAFLKSQIPIELIDKNVDRPGYVEADTVAHCGSSLSGEFGNTLTMTDLLSGWTGNRCTLGKASADILDKIKEIRSDFPFKMVGFA